MLMECSACSSSPCDTKLAGQEDLIYCVVGHRECAQQWGRQSLWSVQALSQTGEVPGGCSAWDIQRQYEDSMFKSVKHEWEEWDSSIFLNQSGSSESFLGSGVTATCLNAAGNMPLNYIMSYFSEISFVTAVTKHTVIRGLYFKKMVWFK